MQFSVFDVLMLCIISVVVFQFWRIRGIAEHAKAYLKRYCEKSQLQLISVARTKTRLGVHKGKLDWRTEFSFEFSGNGEDSYQGTLIMSGLTIVDTQLPAYRIN